MRPLTPCQRPPANERRAPLRLDLLDVGRRRLGARGPHREDKADKSYHSHWGVAVLSRQMRSLAGHTPAPSGQPNGTSHPHPPTHRDQADEPYQSHWGLAVLADRGVRAQAGPHNRTTKATSPTDPTGDRQCLLPDAVRASKATSPTAPTGERRCLLPEPAVAGGLHWEELPLLGGSADGNY